MTGNGKYRKVQENAGQGMENAGQAIENTGRCRKIQEKQWEIQENTRRKQEKRMEMEGIYLSFLVFSVPSCIHCESACGKQVWGSNLISSLAKL